MTFEYYFRVADFVFEVSIPSEQDVDILLPSFKPFRCNKDTWGERIFSFTVSPVCIPPAEESACMLDETSDMGRVRLFRLDGGYRVAICHVSGGPMHHMHAEPDFSSVTASICWDDPHAGNVLCSMLRITYSQAILRYNAISVHASAVYLDGHAYLFMGKSGTGKSTHSALWMKYMEECCLLNDDNPTVRIKDNTAIAYGTPWSGKTSCYKDLCFPVAGMVRLRQAAVNRFLLQKDVEAFITLLPGCSVIHRDRNLHHELCNILVWLSGHVTIGVLDCLPDREAALLCLNEIKRNQLV